MYSQSWIEKYICHQVFAQYLETEFSDLRLVCADGSHDNCLVIRSVSQSVSQNISSNFWTTSILNGSS